MTTAAARRPPLLLIVLVLICLLLVRSIETRWRPPSPQLSDGTSEARVETNDDRSHEDITTDPLPTSKTLRHHNKILHIFTSYDPKTEELKSEMRVVRRSWYEAAKRAYDERGIAVEFACFTLPEDWSTCEQFVDDPLEGFNPVVHRMNLSDTIDDVFKGRIPTVGEPYRLATATMREGEDKTILVSTNSDIGALPPFYSFVYDWATKNYASVEVQREALRRAGEYLARCLLFRDRFKFASRSWHRKMCVEDAKIVFTNEGGMSELLLNSPIATTTMKDLARVTLDNMMRMSGNMTMEDAINVLNATQLAGAIQAMRTVETSDDEKTVEFSRLKVCERSATNENECALARPPSFFAGTITRMDLKSPSSSSDPLLSLRSTREKPYRLSTTLMTRAKMRTGASLPHPGLDCFVIYPLASVPREIQMMGHPQGVRPFGYWLMALLQRGVGLFFVVEGVPCLKDWILGLDMRHKAIECDTDARATQTNFNFRRRAGTTSSPLTFHLGVGLWGMSKIPWVKRAENNPKFALFLASNMNKISNGLITRFQLESQPAGCRQTTEGWRHFSYCKQRARRGEEVCIGMARFACANYLNFQLRDVLVYRDICGEVRQVPINRKPPLSGTSSDGGGDDDGNEDAIRSMIKMEPLRDAEVDAASCEFCNFLARRERRTMSSSVAKSLEAGAREFAALIPIRRCEGRPKSSFCANLCEECC